MILSTPASDCASARTTSGMPLMQLVEHGRLAVLLVRLGALLHGVGFGLAFGAHDLGLGRALHTRRLSLASRFDG